MAARPPDGEGAGAAVHELTQRGATCYAADGPVEALLVLAHGAGAGQRHPFMLGVARGLAARGIAVVTFDFPYMQEGRRVPDRPPVLEGRFREVLGAARGWIQEAPVFIGGKSMGGRIATHLGAQAVEGLGGVLALGYPLHPPAKPEQLRTAHLPALTVPWLIVQGERDLFGTPDELTPVLETVRVPVTLHVVQGGDHSLSVRGRSREDVYREVCEVAARWMTAA